MTLLNPLLLFLSSVGATHWAYVDIKDEQVVIAKDILLEFRRRDPCIDYSGDDEKKSERAERECKTVFEKGWMNLRNSTKNEACEGSEWLGCQSDSGIWRCFVKCQVPPPSHNIISKALSFLCPVKKSRSPSYESKPLRTVIKDIPLGPD